MTTLLAEGGTVVKKRGGERPGAGRPKGERRDVAVKIDKAIADMARAVAKYRGTTLAEVLSETLRQPIGKAYAMMLRDLESQRE